MIVIRRVGFVIFKGANRETNLPVCFQSGLYGVVFPCICTRTIINEKTGSGTTTASRGDQLR